MIETDQVAVLEYEVRTLRTDLRAACERIALLESKCNELRSDLDRRRPKQNFTKADPKKVPEFATITAVDPEFPEAWADFVDHRARTKNPVTPRVMEIMLHELAKHPKLACAALDMVVMSGWRGFKWDWYFKKSER